jgi:hypothetical protein
MSFEISIQEFNRQFQLYQKGNRYNLNVYETDLSYFMIIFFQEEIEDLRITYAPKSTQNIIEKEVKCTSFAFFFERIEDLLDHEIFAVDAYFPKYDFYFNGINNFIEVNYLNRDVLFEIVDRLLNGMDCNYKSRLKTELLINMEFE